MKNLIFLFFIFVFFKTNYSQNTFLIWIPSPTDEISVTDVIENNDGNFIFASNKRYFEPYYHLNAYLLKVNPEGEIIGDYEIELTDTNTGIDNLLIDKDQNIIAIGRTYTSTSDSGRSQLWFLKFDVNFNLIIDKKYSSGYTSVPQSAKFDSDSNIIVTGILFHDPNEISETDDGFVCKFSQVGDSLLFKQLIINQNQTCWEILEKKDSKEFFLFGDNYDDISWGQIIKIDSVFNILSIDSIPEKISLYYIARWLTDTTFILTGKKPNLLNPGPQDDDLGVLVLDTAFNIIYKNQFGQINKIDYPGYLHNLDFIDTSNIYYGGTADMVIGYYFQSDTSWYIINKFDSKLNLKWQKYYGGDAYYKLWSVKATSDGGCLLLGTRYNYLNHADMRDIYIIKLDENGNLTSINNPEIKVKEIIVYPNPVTESIYLQTALKQSMDFEFYDITGKKVLQKKNVDSKSVINIKHLHSGMYFYRITDKQRLIDSGKIIIDKSN
ncbi:MAG: T9SS type A sorting domain-containing protein [Bacteroidia bacterium]|nr:T9SS type A sorting domain-containing protein [Bacteroidia bacterium]